MATYYDTLRNELKAKIEHLQKLLQESLEEERRCKDNSDFEGFADAYAKSKELIDEIVRLEYKCNFIKKNLM